MTLKISLQNSLLQLREVTPLVHNITNSVVMNNTANALLALGASPIMSDATEETAAIIALANSLVINIGTLTSRTTMAMKCAASHAKSSGLPWILDPVGTGATRFRLDTARLLLGYKPAVIRGNAAEIQALFFPEKTLDSKSEARGVDSLIDGSSLIESCVMAARENQVVIAITGATDVMTDGHRVIQMKNGHPMMAKVTGMGCTTSALVGAFLGTEKDPLIATAAALACIGVAGELAGANSRGPGSLQMNILDELYNLTVETLTRHLNIEETEWN